LGALGGDATFLERRVRGERLSPLVQASCARFDARDRELVVAQLERLIEVLRHFGLANAVEAPALLDWLAHALLRAEPDWASLASRYEVSHEGYRELRHHTGRRSLAVTLAETWLAYAGSSRNARADVVPRLPALPEATQSRVVACDIARIDSALSLLEAWWRSLTASTDGTAHGSLTELAASRFFHITHDEAALARFALEAQLLGQLLPGAPIAPLLERIRAFEQSTSAYLTRHLFASSAEGWKQALAATTNHGS
jgi:hypothetical protein